MRWKKTYTFKSYCILKARTGTMPLIIYPTQKTSNSGRFVFGTYVLDICYGQLLWAFLISIRNHTWLPRRNEFATKKDIRLTSECSRTSVKRPLWFKKERSFNVTSESYVLMMTFGWPLTFGHVLLCFMNKLANYFQITRQYLFCLFQFNQSFYSAY